MSLKSYEKEAAKGPFALFMKVGILILCITIVLGTVGFILNPFKQAGSIINKTIDADNVINNYEWFKQQHQDILAIDSKIDNAKQAVDNLKKELPERKDWVREDKEEYSRLSSIHLGLTQQRNDMVSKYNARSRMANRSIFKAGDVELPTNIPQK